MKKGYKVYTAIQKSIDDKPVVYVCECMCAFCVRCVVLVLVWCDMVLCDVVSVSAWSGVYVNVHVDAMPCGVVSCHVVWCGVACGVWCMGTCVYGPKCNYQI